MIQTTLKELARMCKGQLINSEEDLSVKQVSIDTRQMNGAQIHIPIVGKISMAILLSILPFAREL